MDGTHTGKLSAESVRAALRRVRGSALNFVPRDCEAEARPADETAEAEQGQRSAFCKPAATGAAKAGNRNHQGEGISVPRMRAEMGSPWSVSCCDTLNRRPALPGQRFFALRQQRPQPQQGRQENQVGRREQEEVPAFALRLFPGDLPV